ncbi:hemerythrin domain-containing protein [Streptantibioticus cattleyicolor]|uniref:Hemerythrin-like domain-containing protein n=1 Tax=Streptantibioticus cattleyicolor (strain ATCC 35852 / DSM 46488 / JCM 4925 / NBRC 14057 / NRRL 8057) TaxID=1003195 RepID=F8JM50_STREN|nr:hemerythrin domain-containing protein [Streptantibioticus cattleyicolor]AEW99429.1 hypothetical protein SCATT_p12360 [Streptantibioticus cattleyicolor NRRL 8057 = DSM 46488]CCB71532.1 conserved protein of unknown function [Streptantibioticus cattleyicolor NRRL 8057 = DSM 46488]
MGRERADVIAELSADHRGVQRLFDRIRSAAPGSAERGDLVAEVTVELVRHSEAEREYLYPAVRERVVGGAALADKELADHARVERVLDALTHREPDDPDFDELLLTLVTEVTEHATDEEQRLFPKLLAVCPPGTLRELGEKVRSAKRTAPTRPHPGAPDTPPVNKLVAPGTAVSDRLRDLLGRRGRR